VRPLTRLEHYATNGKGKMGREGGERKREQRKRGRLCDRNIIAQPGEKLKDF